jgi:hypothetical protein
MPVPAECQSLADRESALSIKLAELQKSAKEEPEQDVKEAFKAAANKVGLQLADVRSQLKACVLQFGPPPPPTAPQLSVNSIEVVQVIQTFNNSIVLADGPAVVRVFVESGIANGFNAGDGPNCVAGVRGTVTLTDPVTGASSTHTNPIPTSIVARPAWQVGPGNNPALTLNFLVSLPVGVTTLTVRAHVFVTGHEGEQSGFASTRSIEIQVQPAKTQEITPFLIALPANGDATGPTPTQFVSTHVAAATVYRHLRFLVYPAIRLSWAFPVSSISDLRFMLVDLMTAVFTTGTPQGGVRAALVNSAPVGGTGTSGVGWARVGPATPSFISIPNPETYAHEFGHCYGLKHSLCRSGTPEPDADPQLLGHTDATGWNLPPLGIGTVVPSGSGEIMSYCPSPLWPSTVTYRKIFDDSPI